MKITEGQEAALVKVAVSWSFAEGGRNGKRAFEAADTVEDVIKYIRSVGWPAEQEKPEFDEFHVRISRSLCQSRI